MKVGVFFYPSESLVSFVNYPIKQKPKVGNYNKPKGSFLKKRTYKKKKEKEKAIRRK